MNFNITNLKTLCLVFSILFFLQACGQGEFLETKSGFKAKLLRKGNGTPALVNGVAQLNLKYETEDGRVLFDTEKRGGPISVKTNNEERGLFGEVVNSLSIGDSVSFEIPAEDLYEKTYQIALPDSIERGTMLKFNLCLSNTLSMTVVEALQQEEEEKREALIKAHEKRQFEDDLAIIDLFLEENKIKAVKLENGLRYVIHKKGKGSKAKTGDQVNVYYTGKFLINKEIFDQSDRNGEPFSFTIGSGVIEGWSLAFTELKEGSKATFYIPSLLAYGVNGFPGTIPPNSILVFDVELVDIER